MPQVPVKFQVFGKFTLYGLPSGGVENGYATEIFLLQLPRFTFQFFAVEKIYKYHRAWYQYRDNLGNFYRIV